MDKMLPARDASVPNILWICTDSQRWDTLGCYGNEWVTTPVADRLAREGVRFSHVFSQNPLCTPSRGSFLSGRYPVTTRLRQNGQLCPPDLKPVTRTLADAGFVCGLAGKYHLNPCDNRLLLGQEWWRYDQDAFFKGSEQRIDDGYSEFHWDHAGRRADRASAYVQWLHERGFAGDKIDRDDCAFVQRGYPSEFHQATWCADRAINFIGRYADAWHPWLYSVNIFDPHYAFDPPEEYLAPYLDKLDDIPLPVPEPEDERPEVVRSFRQRGRYQEVGERDHRMMRAAYWAMCDHVDAQVGRMLEALGKTGQRDNTLVIFMSDHGEMLGDQGLYTKDQFFYEGAVRVPLIASWPGHVQQGVVCDDLVELADLAPTLLDACQLPTDQSMQGRSLWPLLAGQDGYKARESVYCEFYGSNPKRDGGPPRFATMVRTKKHKLVAVHRRDEGELYDLENDPEERINLWAISEHVQVKCDMLKLLSDRMAETADPLPPRVGVF